MTNAKRKPFLTTRELATVAILAAISAVLFMIEIPVVLFYKLDLSHLPVLLGAGGVGVHIQLPPGCRSRRAGYSAYLDAATGRDGPAVSLRGVQRPAARDSRGHYNGYILRLQSHCGKPAAVLV